MKLTVAPEALRKALTAVLPAIDTKAPNQAFLNVLLEADGEYLRLRATDAVVTASTKIPATVSLSGSIGVSAARLHKIITNFPDVALANLEMKDGSLVVSAKRTKSKLATVEADVFPNWPQPSAPGVALDPKPLLASMKAVRHAMIDDPSRPSLSGMRLALVEGTYLIVSTCDSRRLSRTGALVPSAGGSLDAFLPTRTVKALMKLCELTQEGTIHLSVQGRDAFFWNDAGLGYSSKLVKATPLDPDTIRPSGEPMAMVSFDRLKMIAALTRARAIDEREISFTYAGDSVQLNAASTDGSAEEIVPAAVHGAPATVKLGGSYFAEAIASMKSPSVYLYVWTLRAPLMLVASDNEETYDLLMPMA